MAPRPESWHRRQLVWKHNALFGAAGMANGCMINIINSPTATDKAKDIACSIQTLCKDLSEALKERKE